MNGFHFKVLNQCTLSKARVGVLTTAQGEIPTPAFMPVGTRGAVKALTKVHLKSLQAPIILGNTYHLMLRPGMEIIKNAGGLHRFMQWPNSILTDSGGFQVFSLSDLNQVTEEGVYFRSHIDGSRHFLGPRESLEIQKILGSDIVMAFDQCCPYPCTREEAEKGVERTEKWAKECRNYSLGHSQALFGIVQGGMHADLREHSAKGLVSLDFEGYAIGGLSVGEEAALMYKMLDVTIPHLPLIKPRYLMGVGTPRNLIESVMRGVDMFDCVLPTRNARNGTAFTWNGKLTIKAGKYADDHSALDPFLDNEASQSSKAYVRHLLNVGEMTGMSLVTYQNLAFYLDFMKQLRQSILNGTLLEFYRHVCELYPQ